MNLEELSNKELELSESVETFDGKINQDYLIILNAEFNNIFDQYSLLSNLEALKRGLFLIWYNVSEPEFLNGISELNQLSKNRIINLIENLILQNRIDHELDWMLSYYKNWDYIFEPFKSNNSFYNYLVNSETEFPEDIDKECMMKRGLMGKYWNSLNK